MTITFTSDLISIDGKLDELSWRLAPKSAPFVDIVTGEPAWFDTRAALLWDDDYLYFRSDLDRWQAGRAVLAPRAQVRAVRRHCDRRAGLVRHARGVALG